MIVLSARMSWLSGTLQNSQSIVLRIHGREDLSQTQHSSLVVRGLRLA